MRYLIIRHCVSERTVHLTASRLTRISENFWGLNKIYIAALIRFPYKIHFSEIKHHQHTLCHYNNQSTSQTFVKLLLHSKDFFRWLSWHKNVPHKNYFNDSKMLTLTRNWVLKMLLLAHLQYLYRPTGGCGHYVLINQLPAVNRQIIAVISNVQPFVLNHRLNFWVQL